MTLEARRNWDKLLGDQNVLRRARKGGKLRVINGREEDKGKYGMRIYYNYTTGQNNYTYFWGRRTGH